MGISSVEDHHFQRQEKVEFDGTASQTVKWESDGWAVALEGKLINWDQ